MGKIFHWGAGGLDPHHCFSRISLGKKNHPGNRWHNSHELLHHGPFCYHLWGVAIPVYELTTVIPWSSNPFGSSKRISSKSYITNPEHRQNHSDTYHTCLFAPVLVRGFNFEKMLVKLEICSPSFCGDKFKHTYLKPAPSCFKANWKHPHFSSYNWV